MSAYVIHNRMGIIEKMYIWIFEIVICLHILTSSYPDFDGSLKMQGKVEKRNFPLDRAFSRSRLSLIQLQSSVKS